MEKKESIFTPEDDRKILSELSNGVQLKDIAEEIGKPFKSVRNRRAHLLTRFVLGAPLSDREHYVLDLISLGNTNAKIAEKLDISKRTVDTYRVNAIKKLGASNIAHAIRLACEQRIL